jgi:hypothetical protein
VRGGGGDAKSFDEYGCYFLFYFSALARVGEVSSTERSRVREAAAATLTLNPHPSSRAETDLAPNKRKQELRYCQKAVKTKPRSF